MHNKTTRLFQHWMFHCIALTNSSTHEVVTLFPLSRWLSISTQKGHNLLFTNKLGMPFFLFLISKNRLLMDQSNEPADGEGALNRTGCQPSQKQATGTSARDISLKSHEMGLSQPRSVTVHLPSRSYNPLFGASGKLWPSPNHEPHGTQAAVMAVSFWKRWFEADLSLQEHLLCQLLSAITISTLQIRCQLCYGHQ